MHDRFLYLLVKEYIEAETLLIEHEALEAIKAGTETQHAIDQVRLQDQHEKAGYRVNAYLEERYYGKK